MWWLSPTLVNLKPPPVSNLAKITVPDSKSRNIPEVVVVWRQTVGVWEFGRGGIVG